PNAVGARQMAVIAVNASNGQIDGQDTVRRALAALPEAGGITVMAHGFRSCPFTPDASPHNLIYATDRRRCSWKSVSWPHYLGLTRAGAGLGIGFAWPALGRLGQAATRAWRAGDAMARLFALIAAERPDARVHAIAHSLGVRVALRALSAQPAGAVDTLVLLTGAEFRGAARRAAFSPAGRTARILNVTSGENAVFEGLFRILAPGREPLAPALSAGLGAPHPGWLDLRIDAATHLRALRSLGYRPASPARRVCHWSAYLRPGLFPLYRDLFGPDGAAAFARLRQALPAPVAASGAAALRRFAGARPAQP
ncbi:MAG: hypothetical protein AAF914_13430, partial [Pseudomonadota bacterium]